jgi:hypothetical protein
MKFTSLRKTVLTWTLLATTSLGFIQPASAFADKIRFLGDLGIAYYCFHHWVSAPFKEGDFSASQPHHVKAIIKAGVALLFAVNRVKAADKIAHTSNDPLLRKLAGGLDSLEGTVSSLGTQLKGGHFNPADMAALGGGFGGLKTNALSEGLNIQDKAIAVPGL